MARRTHAHTNLHGCHHFPFAHGARGKILFVLYRKQQGRSTHGAKIAEGEFERALLFCGTGMGIHIAASKCPGVHAGVVESVPAALRAITGNGVNVLAMGAFYVAPQTACDIADAFLYNDLGSGYEWWPNFYEFHKLAIDELDAFDYQEFKKNGFRLKHLGECPIKLEEKPENIR